MCIEDRISYYEKNYDVIANYDLGVGAKIYIGDDDKICRFCGKKYPDVTFKNIAHAVPEFLGNKQLILRNECDLCNTNVSENYEDHLDKYTIPFRAAAQIKGKNKIPTYATNDKNGRFEVGHKDGPRIVDQVGGEFISIDDEKKVINTNFELKPHQPNAVYKCLVKIALSVVEDEELNAFSNTLKILTTFDSVKTLCKPQVLLKTFIPGPNPNSKIKIIIFRRRNNSSSIPYCISLLCFGNLAYQIIVPSDFDLDPNDKEKSYTLVRFPLPFEKNWEYGPLVYDNDDLTTSDIVRGKKIPLKFSFEESIEVDENTITL